MKKLIALSAFTLLTLGACAPPNAGPVVTEETLAGCWQGSLFGYSAKVNIDDKGINDSGRKEFSMNGTVDGPGGFKMERTDVIFTLEPNGELKPQNLSEAEAKALRLETNQARIKAILTDIPFASVDLNRCDG